MKIRAIRLREVGRFSEPVALEGGGGRDGVPGRLPRGLADDLVHDLGGEEGPLVPGSLLGGPVREGEEEEAEDETCRALEHYQAPVGSGIMARVRSRLGCARGWSAEPHSYGA